MRDTLQRIAERSCDWVMEHVCSTSLRSTLGGGLNGNLNGRLNAGGRQPPQIIAHRGAWDHGPARENTLAAFARAAALGVWAIELDVRFTRDNVPVVLHDPGLYRLFRISRLIAELTCSELALAAPLVPRLQEVLDLAPLHFMIEIKTALSREQVAILRDVLGRREAVRDFHFLVLDENLIRPEFPAAAWVLVGDLRLKSLVDVALTRGLGGVAGHYLSMTKRQIARLHAAGQKAGSGFVASTPVFEREWSRGVDWVFTNDSAVLRPPPGRQQPSTRKS